MLLYRDLVPWYRLIDPTEDHREEAASYQSAIERVTPDAETLLELGAGAGNNAFFFKRRFRCTLTDLSEEMLALSREINPDCEQIAGDMRTLRLGRTFDAVMVHDAVCYMTTVDDLLLVARTAFAHTRSGGCAVFAPDCIRDTFREATHLLECDSMRGIEWMWDPDPNDDTYRVDYAFLLRDGEGVRSVHDVHIEGLFSRETWVGVLSSVGYEVGILDRPIDEDDLTNEVFICRAP